MSDAVSNIGLQLVNIINLKAGQSYLSLLTQQMTTGKQSLNLTDYSASDAQKLLNFTSSVTQREGFIAVADTISPRLKIYDQSLTSIEEITAQAASLATTSATYNPTTNGSTAEQIQTFMRQMNYYLNQQVGDRYIFAGTRYGTAPVADITGLTSPPTETTPYLSDIDNDALPAYDTDFDSLDPSAAVPEAYIRDTVAVDSSQDLTYGITSTQAGFQQIIMGLRFAYAATQDQSQYETYMDTARQLFNDGLNAVRSTHTALSGNTAILEQTKQLHQKLISDINGQVGDIQNVDINAVAIKINSFQSQLEASYAATGTMTRLSLLKYL